MTGLERLLGLRVRWSTFDRLLRNVDCLDRDGCVSAEEFLAAFGPGDCGNNFQDGDEAGARPAA